MGFNIKQEGGISTSNVEKYSLQTEDIMTRIDAMELRKKGYKEVYPLLSSTESFTINNSRKESIFRFVLSQIPEPAEDVPLEQILDFKQDVDTMNKYFAADSFKISQESIHRPYKLVVPRDAHFKKWQCYEHKEITSS